MEREQAVRLTQNLLRKMVEREGSDLFITAGFPPAIKVDGTIHKATDTPLNADQAAMMVRSIMNDKQIKEFDATKECNFAIAPKGIGRFRVSAFIQQGMPGAVLRTITTEIPTLEELELPPILKDVVMNKRGIVIVVGGTGSGKSTTLAAMIGHRNENSRGHIVSIEDGHAALESQQVVVRYRNLNGTAVRIEVPLERRRDREGHFLFRDQLVVHSNKSRLLSPMFYVVRLKLRKNCRIWREPF